MDLKGRGCQTDLMKKLKGKELKATPPPNQQGSLTKWEQVTLSWTEILKRQQWQLCEILRVLDICHQS